jgi:hypothetical protein
MTRKSVTDRKTFNDYDVFEGTFETVISNLSRAQSEIVTQYPEAIDSDIRVDCVFDYDGGKEWYVEFIRFETDKEMQTREKQEAKIKEVKKRKELEERALYEKLKKKFGD